MVRVRQMESIERAVNYFKQMLRREKMRFTRQREAIVRHFLSSEGHLCVDELFRVLKKKYRSIGYATVCRTVKLLKSTKLATEVNFTGKRRRFEHAFEHTHHDHFICEMCGRVKEIRDKEFEKQQLALCRKYGFSGEKHMLQISGTCKRCLK